MTIAAQACLLILERNAHYFPKLGDILVYPGAFVVERVSGGPCCRPSTRACFRASRGRTGRSCSRGRSEEGAAIADDGRNVVIHEFAHQLDQEKGDANGAPWLGRRDRYPRWSRVMNEEYARLQYNAAWRAVTLQPLRGDGARGILRRA